MEEQSFKFPDKKIQHQKFKKGKNGFYYAVRAPEDLIEDTKRFMSFAFDGYKDFNEWAFHGAVETKLNTNLIDLLDLKEIISLWTAHYINKTKGKYSNESLRIKKDG